MKSIIKYFIQHPTVVNLFVILLVAIGLLSLLQTKRTAFPQQDIRLLSTIVVYPGATPTEVEEGVTIKIEENLEGIQGIDRVTSTSQDNLASIIIELEEDTDANVVLAEVKNAVDKISNFPQGAESPVISKIEPIALAIALGVVGDAPLQTINRYAEEVKDDLLLYKGISQVFVEGTPEEEIVIQVREQDMRAYNLSFMEVRNAVASANLETFGGSIKTGTENISIKANNKGYYADELRNLTVRANSDGSTIKLSEIADIKDQFADVATARYLNKERAVTVSVYSLNEEDILGNAERVKAYIDDFNNTHESVQLKVLEDGTIALRDRLSTMVNNGVVGFLLVLIVLALFLDRYLAFWVALKIPVAIIGMFIFASMYGMTINVVSLFGFIVVLGILVDDGVVIGENIYQHAKEKGKPPLQAALDGTMEMLTPVLLSLSTTGVAFSLFFFLPTIAGDFFGEMAFVVITVLLLAMIESFFILPAHLAHSKGLRDDVKVSKLEQVFNNFVTWLRDKLYLPAANFLVMKNRWLTFLLFVGMLGGTLFFASQGNVSFTFFPNLDDDAVFVELEMPAGTSKEVTKQKLEALETAVWQVNEDYSSKRKDDQQVVQFVEQITGPLENQGKLKITYLGGEARGISSFELNNAIREAAPPLADAKSVVYGIGATTAAFGKPIEYSLKSKNLKELRQAKEELKAELQALPELKDVSDNDRVGAKELYVELLPNAELLGLRLADVMNQVRSGFFGLEAQRLQRDDKEVKVWVRYDEEGRASVEQLQQMRIRTPNGGAYPLSEIAQLSFKESALSIQHLDGQREIRLDANIANLSVSAPETIARINADIIPPILDKYASVTYSLEGQNRNSAKIGEAAGVVGPIVLLLMLALIVLNFNSFSQMLIVFGLFPFALIGVIWGHWLQGTALSIFSIIGTIALIGVFVNNSLVLVSTFNDKLREGMEFSQAMLETLRSRFRPILLTTITTVAGLAPLILSSSLGSQFLKGPAIAISYGLSFGILNVLILLPALVLSINTFRRFSHNLFHKNTASAEQVEPAVKQQRYLMEN
ncbi:MAG: efflux RND transporter permease subunit [Bacteroidota bacterium]